MENNFQGTLRIYRPRKTVMDMKMGDQANILMSFWKIFLDKNDILHLYIPKSSPIYRFSETPPEDTFDGGMAVYAMVIRINDRHGDYRDFQINLVGPNQMSNFNLFSALDDRESTSSDLGIDYLIYKGIPYSASEKYIYPGSEQDTYKPEEDPNLEKKKIPKSYDLSLYENSKIGTYSLEVLYGFLGESIRREKYEISAPIRDELQKRGIKT